MQADVEGFQKIQNYQRQVATVEVGMLDSIVRQSGLHMEEVLRRQRRKKKFFYDHMRSKFGPFWNPKVEELSKAKFTGVEKKGLKLFALKEGTEDINEVLKQCINEIWDDYDADGSGVLEKPETKLFV